MAGMNLKRARRWAIGLPIGAGTAILADVALSRLEFVQNLYISNRLYFANSSFVWTGIVFAGYFGAAAWIAGIVPKRRLPTAAVILWGLAFGWWICFAVVGLCLALFGHVCFADVELPNDWWRRILAESLAVAGAGLGTSFLLWWATRARRVFLWSLSISCAAALGVPAGEWWSLGLTAVVLLWHVATAALLGSWIVLEVRGRAMGPICPECGYDLTGLTGGACPECGRLSAAGRA